jgi:integrase
MAALRAQKGLAAAALEFLILTAARTGEVLNARWDEINFLDHLWTIPAERMKAGKEHRVPLSEPALAVLKRLTGESGEFVLPGTKPEKPLSDRSMLRQLERMGHPGLTVHGFRSTFRDWAAELSNFPREVIEHALAHSLLDKVEAAYQRGDLFEKRRQLMDAWAKYCEQPVSTGSVVTLKAK